MALAISDRALNGKLVVVESLDLAEAKTKQAQAALAALGVKHALIVFGEDDANFFRAARNLAAHKVLPLAGLNVYDVLNYDELLMTTKTAQGDRGATRGRRQMSAEALIIAPLITEKGTIASEKANQVVFRVRPEASKDKIRAGRSRRCSR